MVFSYQVILEWKYFASPEKVAAIQPVDNKS